MVTRILAGVAVMPFLTLFANFSGPVGASIVTSSMGYPLVTFISQIKTATNLTDLLGGLVKALVFGILVAGIGCYRGLETESGASAVAIPPPKRWSAPSSCWPSRMRSSP